LLPALIKGRQIDREVYGYQVDGALVGLLTLSVDEHKLLDWVTGEEFRQEISAAV
jgi:hypothetical protein